MKQKIIIFIFIILFLFCSKNSIDNSFYNSIPDVRTKEYKQIIHSKQLTDNYYWLNNREDTTVINYIKRENAYTQKISSNWKQSEDSIYNEFLSRIKQTDLSVPYRMGNYIYYYKTIEGKQYSIFCRKDKNGMEHTLIDENKLGDKYNYFYITNIKISPSENFILFSIDTLGNEDYLLMIKDIRKDSIYSIGINNISSIEWGVNDSIIYYTKENISKRPWMVLRFNLFNNKEDTLFIDMDERFWVWIEKSKDNKFLLYGSASKNTSEMGYLRLGVDKNFNILFPRKQGIEYYIKVNTEYMYILTNENAYNFKIQRYNFSNKTIECFVEHSKNTLLDFELFKNYLVVYERQDGLPALHVYNTLSKENYYIEFPESSYSIWFNNNKVYDTDTIRFSYSSFITPTIVYDYNMKTREFIIKKQKEVLGGYNKNDYIMNRILINTSDGIKIPLSIVYKKGIDIKDKNYFILDGYGAYGSANDPYFSSFRLSLLNRGIVMGIAHIRGGGEYGRKWYDEGRLLNKKNTFYDFINVCKFLIDNEYTDKDKLIIRGGSAGGLLIGAVLNMHPELYKAAILSVPFVDVVNTMLNDKLPLTVPEYEEWGDPNDSIYFEYMYSYSPYDNIKKQCYPDILIMGGMEDARVSFWEPLKYIAKLRDNNICNSLMLLKMNMAGHGGSSGRYDFYREIAFEYAFILWEFGLK